MVGLTETLPLLSHFSILYDSFGFTCKGGASTSIAPEKVLFNVNYKHATFSTLQYAKDFGTISKESLKRVSKWAAKYFTHQS